MYGPTKAVGACTSAKDFVKIVRRTGGEPINWPQIDHPRSKMGNWKLEKGDRNERTGGRVFRYFGTSVLRQLVFHNSK